MQVVIRGRQLPGRSFHEAEWRTEVEIVERDGPRDFRGSAVQGKRGQRFLYLTWGDVQEQTVTMFRRAKLMLDDIPSSTVIRRRRPRRLASPTTRVVRAAHA